MRRTGWKKTPDLSSQMKWRYANDPSLMTWTVKAINRSMAFWTVFFSPLLVIPLIAFIATLFYGVSLLSWLAVFCFLFALFLYVKVGLERTVYVYRSTSEHLEICQWQDIPDMVFTFLRVFPFLIAGIILMLFISSPGLSIAALVGPALLGILIASFGADSNYKKMYKDLDQQNHRWDEIIEALVDSHHGLIRLRWPHELPPEIAAQVENPEQYYYQGALLYFRKDQEEQVTQLVKRKLPQGLVLEEGRHKYDFSG
ncbi:ABC transporter ATP-binding protein [Halopseudomonas pelagia]|uniref:ABC transporter ATP-binding protein n=1 Tax=Halopseudomonas pelagia TaxID=553151 RepID=UPI00126934E7|nr:ABC transporter ATP-binding protein [Halopseudomonas pelagia]